MYKGFLKYLYDRDLITAEQAEKTLKFVDNCSPNYDFLSLYFFHLTSEQINNVKALMNDLSTKSYQYAIENLGYGDISQIWRFNSEYQKEDIIYAQLICSLEFLSIEEVNDNLLLYSTSAIFKDNATYLPSEPDLLIPAFVDSYANIILVRLKNCFDPLTILAETVKTKEISAKTLVCQEIVSKEHSFLLGLATDNETTKDLIKVYFGNDITREVIRTSFNSEEKQLDFLSEILNNSNGICTSRYNISFDLDLPHVFQNITIKSDTIYSLKYEINIHKICFFVIYGKKYTFKNHKI